MMHGQSAMNLTRFVHPAARWLPWLSVSKGLRPVSGLARVAIDLEKPTDQYTAFPSYADSGRGCIYACLPLQGQHRI
ncbi:MAG: hypothetical protein RL571_2127 [Pseudomonadota bacterium]|jgi:hypothetical protein